MFHSTLQKSRKAGPVTSYPKHKRSKFRAAESLCSLELFSNNLPSFANVLWTFRWRNRSCLSLAWLLNIPLCFLWISSWECWIDYRSYWILRFRCLSNFWKSLALPRIWLSCDCSSPEVKFLSQAKYYLLFWTSSILLKIFFPQLLFVKSKLFLWGKEESYISFAFGKSSQYHWHCWFFVIRE